MNRQLLLKILILRKIQRRLKRKSWSIYIRPIFLNRDLYGESFLVAEMRNDPHYHNRYFRMNQENFDEILHRIELRINHAQNHLRPISAMERLAITLRYLATGSSQVLIALNYRVSPSSVSKILRETMQAICDEMTTEQLPSPTEEIWKSNEQVFSTKWNFPNACGALHGKHIRIVAPSNTSSVFYNYKTFFSIVLLAVAGPTYLFTAVDIGSSGSQSDGGILMNSTMGKRLLNETFHLPGPKKIEDNGLLLPHVILGDDGFPLKPYLMRLFKGHWLEKSHKIFNYRLSRARMVVENTFGILSARWRIFRTMIDADVELVKLITLTSVILHNYLIRKNDINSITTDHEENGNQTNGNWRELTNGDNGLAPLSTQGSNNYSNDAAKVREEFKKYMISDNGSLSWQDNYVTRGS